MSGTLINSAYGPQFAVHRISRLCEFFTPMFTNFISWRNTHGRINTLRLNNFDVKLGGYVYFPSPLIKSTLYSSAQYQYRGEQTLLSHASHAFMAQPLSESPAFPDLQIAMTPSQSQTMSVLGISSPPEVISTPEINSLYRGYAPATMVCIKSYKCMVSFPYFLPNFYILAVSYFFKWHVFWVTFW